MGDREEEFLAEGWHPVENWPPLVRWTQDRASLYLRRDSAAQLLGIAMCRPHHSGDPVTGRILVEDVNIGDFSIATPDFERYLFPLQPAEDGQIVQIEIIVDETVLSQESGRSRDGRHLGVAVREVWLE